MKLHDSERPLKRPDRLEVRVNLRFEIEKPPQAVDDLIAAKVGEYDAAVSSNCVVR